MATLEEAKAQVAKAAAELAAAEADEKVATEAAARPRPAMSIVIDIVRLLVSRAGNHPDLEKLEAELNASVAQNEPK